MNGSEPLTKHRNLEMTTSKPQFSCIGGKNTADDLICWLYGVRCRDGTNLNAGSLMEREKQCFHAKGKAKQRTCKADNTDGRHCGGLWHSSGEVSVMEAE